MCLSFIFKEVIWKHKTQQDSNKNPRKNQNINKSLINLFYTPNFCRADLEYTPGSSETTWYLWVSKYLIKTSTVKKKKNQQWVDL